MPFPSTDACHCHTRPGCALWRSQGIIDTELVCCSSISLQNFQSLQLWIRLSTMFNSLLSVHMAAMIVVFALQHRYRFLIPGLRLLLAVLNLSDDFSSCANMLCNKFKAVHQIKTALILIKIAPQKVLQKSCSWWDVANERCALPCILSWWKCSVKVTCFAVWRLSSDPRVDCNCNLLVRSS